METIKSSKEIDLIFRNGKKLRLPFLTFVLLKGYNEDINGEVAFIAGKKNGNAVWRSKSKRRLREIYRNLNVNENYKILMIANKNILNFKFEEIVLECKKNINKYCNEENN